MCQECHFEGHLEDLEGFCEDDALAWANDTLCGIRDTITDKKHITERQIEAICNIVNARRDR